MHSATASIELDGEYVQSIKLNKVIEFLLTASLLPLRLLTKT